MISPPLLSIDGITFGYNAQQPVLRGLSGEMHRGKLCAMIGPNAAGKTTLLKMILGQLQPDQGAVLLQQKPVHKLSFQERAKILSYVPQRANVNFAFTVRQVVAMGRYALPANSQAVDQAIKETELTSLEEQVYAHLSVGQQQRVLLARALAQAADGGKMMLLDEPGSAMDMRHLHQTMQMLRRLADQGMAILVVVHDLNLAAQYADDVWLIHQGTLMASGPWQQVLQPAVLEPIYQIRLQPTTTGHNTRPAIHPKFPIDLL